jgi:membrane-associated protease RseP (regulator of RpoE activity)
MAYVLGIALFAFGILVSVCLHEAGHMSTAKAFGMKVTKYFVGFGPTLWSFRRGETEYGVKAIPAGGFVKIVGMTPLEDDVEDGDQPRAFWRRPLWQRTVVLSAGSVTHFVLGLVLLWVAAAFVGLPNPALASYDPAKEPAVLGTVSNCVPTDPNTQACPDGAPPSPAKAAGLRAGDRIVSLGGTPTPTYGDLVRVTRAAPAAPAVVEYERDGTTARTTVTVIRAERNLGTTEEPDLQTVGVLGVTARPPEIPLTVTYGPVDAVGEAFSYTGDMFVATFQAIGKFPEKVPKLIDALRGEERDPETPVSVVGASRIGGEAVEQGVWPLFLLLLASLNLFIGVFNLFPLLPLDGGHIAIAWFERVRSWIAAKRGRPDPGRVDYNKLMPVTYAVILVFGGITLLTIATDILNPITLYSR